MIGINIDIPASDLAAMRDAFARYVTWFRKGPQEAVKKTCVYVVRSLRADTKQSAKHRRVVRNPNYVNVNSRRAQNKRLRQLAHIRAWYESRGQAAPKDTAEYFNRYAIERLTQRKGTRYTPVFMAMSITEAKRIAQSSMMDQYMIKRRGLAKSSWGWMLGKLGKQTATDQQQISGTTEVTSGTTGGAFETYYVDLINKLAYIRKATKASVGSVIGRAQRAMKDEMEGHVKRARQQAGLRAA
jgi:hypothetical protein